MEDKVLQRLEDFGVAIKPKKCKIGFSKTEYMGYMVGSERVEMLKDRAEAIRGVKVPARRKSKDFWECATIIGSSSGTSARRLSTSGNFWWQTDGGIKMLGTENARKNLKT